ncbi:MAG: EcsC family protein [Candidatus Eremiobacteraeota bacterium]|nr:EcsC family protein [Candidatus Eremiobacteraeota bacterium]
MHTGRLWVGRLTDDEREVLKETEAWLLEPPGLLARSLAVIGKPIDFAYNRVPESIREAINRKIYGVLSAVRESSGNSVRPQETFDRISAEVGRDVTALDQLFEHDVRCLDRVALEFLQAGRRAAAFEGGATGLAGLAGLVVDVPALYWLIFRTVQSIAICYGFPIDSAEEVAHILKVVDVGHHLESDKKRRGMLELESLQVLIRRGLPIQDLERAAVAKGLQALARKLTARLARRKVAQSIAVVGALIGAGVNRALVNDVGLTAFYSYRRRFLREVAERRL